MPSERTQHISEDDLSALLDSELRGAAKARCDAHLEACGGCRDALDELTAVRSSVRALPRARARRSFAVRESDVPSKRASLLVHAMPMLSGAMVVSLVAFLALVGVDLGGGVSNNSSSSASYHAFAVKSSGSVEKSLTNRGPATSLSPQPGADEPAPPSANNSEFDSSAPATPEDRNAARGLTKGGNDASQGAPAADPVPTTPTVVPALRRVSSNESGRDTGLRIAEAVAAALALASGGLAVVAWRRSG